MTTTADELREEVRRRYAESALAVAESSVGCGCGEGSCCARRDGAGGKSFVEAFYEAEQRGELPEAATLASLGCGNPTAVAELREGEIVLDLGSGGGIDVILSAKRVGPTGTAYGLDMTDEMLALARKNASEAGLRERALPQGRDRADPAPGGLGRRGDLELRDQPLGRQAGRADRDRPRAEAGRTDRDQRHRRRGPSDRRSSGPSAAASSAASPARSRRASTRPGSRRPGSSEIERRVHPRGRRRACTARSSRRSRRASLRRRGCR